MTTEQLDIAGKLFFNTSFQVGSWDKKFTKSMAEIARTKPSQNLTDKQGEMLYRLLYKYRNQTHNKRLYEKYKDHPHCQPMPKK